MGLDLSCTKQKNGNSLFIHRNMTYQILTYNAAQREKKQTRKYSLAFCVEREASSSRLLQFAEHTGILGHCTFAAY